MSTSSPSLSLPFCTHKHPRLLDVLLDSGWHPLPNRPTQRLVPPDPGAQAPARFALEQQVRDHAPEHDAAPVVQVREVALLQVVRVRRVTADAVDVLERIRVQVQVGGAGLLGRRDGVQPLVVEAVGRVVRGVGGKAAAGQRG